MIDIENIFKDKKFDKEKLLSFGFSLENGEFTKDLPILQGEFWMRVTVRLPSKEDFHVFEKKSGEEYFLARVKNASGAFIGEVHAACEEAFKIIAENCCSVSRFQNEQTARVLRYIEQKYYSQPEFLWEKFPSFAVLRVKDKKDWFALLGKVEIKKLKKEGEGVVEILNLKNEPDKIKTLIASDSAYPAYHMNKTHWCSLILNDALKDEDIFLLIDESYHLASCS